MLHYKNKIEFKLNTFVHMKRERQTDRQTK